MTTVLNHKQHASREVIPPLENGDRLTRPEFERRWNAMPELKRAELIDGVVHMQAAVRWLQHGGPHSDLTTWLGVFGAMTAGVDCGDNSSLRLDLDNAPQPDAFLRIAPECGGQSDTDDEGYVAGAPELVAEVAASSVSYDSNAKLEVYRRHGVREYVVWRVMEEEVDWFRLEEGHFKRAAPDDDGILRSNVFPGLWLDPAALLRRDLARVLEVLRQGTSTPDHAAFVTRLAEARGSA